MLYRSLLPLLLIISSAAWAQSLYMPRDVKRAYQKQTRSLDGKPGKNYWQNFARYVIDVTVTPPDRSIKGKEVIRYFNNSTDTIRRPSMKLFLNIHKPGAQRDWDVSPDFLNEGLTIDSLSINGSPVKVNNQSVFTNYSPRLPTALAPHDSIDIVIEWHYEISLLGTREGIVDSTTYFLALFYPRVAVFDDYSGWDRVSYSALREFYSDFNDYDVTINLPRNFVAWGTGTLQEPQKLLQPAILKKYLQSQQVDETVHIITANDISAKAVTTQNLLNSWRFTSTKIPDVAFGISDHYVWDGTSVVADDKTGRRVNVQAAYNDTAKEYHQMITYSRHAVDWFSHHWPGIPFPYEKSAIFQTFEEMEYPMMVKGGVYDDSIFAKFVAEHEIVHNYMPFYMGTNETRYGFMDEGWATTFELLIGISDRGVEAAEEFYRQFRVEGWAYNNSAGEDVPIITPSENLVGSALGDNEYGKPSMGFLALKDMLGDSLFKKCLHAFMERWHGKHPIPWDMFFSFNNVSGKNLNWFWNSWFFSNNYIDLGIESVKSSGKAYLLSMKNIGGIPAPVDIVVNYSDGTKEVFHQTPLVWQQNLKKVSVRIEPGKKPKSIELDGGIFMDTDKSNNSIQL
jgi:hypothetical protein